MVAGHEEPIRQVFEEIRRIIESKGEVLVVDCRMQFR
jgi:hypothetical protein